jgi:hypothetical protein
MHPAAAAPDIVHVLKGPSHCKKLLYRSKKA